MNCNFHVGQKVVCVGDFSSTQHAEWAIVFGVEFPEQGSVYTVREIVAIDPEFEEEGSIGIRLQEILNLPNPCRASGGKLVDREIVFHPMDFRPLVESKTDISLFTEMLTGKKAKVDA